MGVPPRYKGHPRGHLFFYGSKSSSWGDLVSALGNRGYEIESCRELIGFDSLPDDLPVGRRSKILQAVVVYVGDEIKRGNVWGPLIHLSNVNEWSVAHQNAHRIRKPNRRRT